MPTFTDLETLDTTTGPASVDAAAAPDVLPSAHPSRSPSPVGRPLPTRAPLSSNRRPTLPLRPSTAAGDASDDAAGRRARLELSLTAGALSREQQAHAAGIMAANRALAESPDPGPVPVRAALLVGATGLASLVAGAGLVGLLSATASQPMAVALAGFCVASGAVVSLCWRPTIWAVGVVSGILAAGVVVLVPILAPAVPFSMPAWVSALQLGHAALVLVGSIVALTASHGFDPSLSRWRAARSKHITAHAAVNSRPLRTEISS